MAAEDLIELYKAHLREMSRTKRTIDTYEDQLLRADKLLPFGLDCATEDELRAFVRKTNHRANGLLAAARHGRFSRWLPVCHS